MTKTISPKEFSELLSLMKSLARLVDPLKAIIDAEKKPDLTERIENFLSEVNRIGTLMERAVTAMEKDREELPALKSQLELQGQKLDKMSVQVEAILGLFDAPLDGRAQN